MTGWILLIYMVHGVTNMGTFHTHEACELAYSQLYEQRDIWSFSGNIPNSHKCFKVDGLVK